jgi:hypothetical protein
MAERAYDRRAPRLTALVAVALTVAIGVGLGAANAADPRLDTADAALVQAANLLEASQSGQVDAKRQKVFDKAVAGALADIADARVRIAEAKAAVDNP